MLGAPGLKVFEYRLFPTYLRKGHAAGIKFPLEVSGQAGPEPTPPRPVLEPESGGQAQGRFLDKAPVQESRQFRQVPLVQDIQKKAVAPFAEEPQLAPGSCRTGARFSERQEGADEQAAPGNIFQFLI